MFGVAERSERQLICSLHCISAHNTGLWNRGSAHRMKTALSAQTGFSGVTYLGRGLRSDGVAIILLGAGAVVVAWTLSRVTTFL